MKVDWYIFVRENLVCWSLFKKTATKSSFKNFQKQLPLREVHERKKKQLKKQYI